MSASQSPPQATSSSSPQATPARIEVDADGMYVVYVALQGKEQRYARCLNRQQAEAIVKRYGIVPDGYYGNAQLKGAALRGAKAKARRALGPKPSSATDTVSVETSSEDGEP